MPNTDEILPELLDEIHRFRDTPNNPVTIEDRRSTARALAETFIAQRMGNATLAEQVRSRALATLLDKIDTMSDSRLIQLLTLLHEQGAVDMQTVVGGGDKKSGGGGDINIFLDGEGAKKSGGQAAGMAMLPPSTVKLLEGLMQAAELIVNEAEDKSGSTEQDS